MAALKAHFALKALVILLGLVILVLLGAVVFGLLRQAEQLATEPEAESEVVSWGSGPLRTADPAELEIAVPVGCLLAESHFAEDLLVLRLDGPAERGCQQVVLVDPAAGVVVARVSLAPER